LYGLLTNPIGCEVNIRGNASISHINANKAVRRSLLIETPDATRLNRKRS